MTPKNVQFDSRYLRALRLHLGRSRRDGVTAGKVVGRAALAEGIGAGGVVRSHARALRALAPERFAGNDGGAVLRRSEAFLLSVLAPFEAIGRAVEGADGRERELRGALRRKTAALAHAERDRRVAQVRTEHAEAELAKAVRHDRYLLARSQVAQEQLRRMTRRVITAQEEERKLISRELHDEIAQILTGINVQLAILKQASTVNDRGLRQRIAHTQRFVEKSVTAVHRFARELRPAVLDVLGLVPALRALIRNQPEGRSLHIRFVSDPGIEVLDGAKRTVIYRVAQEALTNVARHAHATQATVQVKKSPLGIELEVRDNGRAFDVQRVLGSRNRKHLGLLGMRERVEMVGGVLTIESSPGKGTAICAHIPLKKTAKAASP